MSRKNAAVRSSEGQILRTQKGVWRQTASRPVRLEKSQSVDSFAASNVLASGVQLRKLPGLPKHPPQPHRSADRDRTKYHRPGCDSSLSLGSKAAILSIAFWPSRRLCISFINVGRLDIGPYYLKTTNEINPQRQMRTDVGCVHWLPEYLLSSFKPCAGILTIMQNPRQNRAVRNICLF